jgi:TPR repeat protein
MSGVGLEAGNRALILGAYSQAYEIFCLMVEDGEDPAFYKLCEMAIHQQLNDRQQVSLKERLETAVQHGNEAACYNSAVLTERGVLFDHSPEKAERLFKRACGSSVPQAYAALVRLYLAHRPKFPTIRNSDITDLLKDGIRYGDPGAAYLLGMLHTKGEIVKQCYESAGKFLFAAEKHGHREAITLISIIGHMDVARVFNAQKVHGHQLYHDMRDRNVEL